MEGKEYRGSWEEDRREPEVPAYVEVFPGDHPLLSDDDACNLIALCMEKSADRLLIHENVLADEFYKLRTGVAGIFLQKFVNYSIRTAIVTGDQSTRGSTFSELLREVNRGDQIRFFEQEEAARKWLA